jgi:hypothetical protein
MLHHKVNSRPLNHGNSVLTHGQEQKIDIKLIIHHMVRTLHVKITLAISASLLPEILNLCESLTRLTLVHGRMSCR